jgi:SEC-C motif-containing protein
METYCPCGSGSAYSACCGPLHEGTDTAQTALQLMRSRYSAFAVGDGAYLLATWDRATRPATVDPDPVIEWRRLQIRDVTSGTEADETGTVEFVAHYWDSERREYGRHHENSRFIRHDRRWFYVEPAL